MFHYVIDQLRKFALPHKTNQSFTKIDPSFTVQDRFEFPTCGHPQDFPRDPPHTPCVRGGRVEIFLLLTQLMNARDVARVAHALVW